MAHSSDTNINPRSIRVRANNTTGPTDFGHAALEWYRRGFKVIPLVPGEKRTAVKWDLWLDNLSEDKVRHHWGEHPNHEVGCICGEELIVFDADTPEAVNALYAIEKRHLSAPLMRVKTAKGEHHYFFRPPHISIKSDSHDSERHPERIDIKAGRALVVMPPSTGKALFADSVTEAHRLHEVDQGFVDAIYAHTGREAPRPPSKKAPSPRKFSSTSKIRIRQIQAPLEHRDPDLGYAEWLSVLMAVHHETGGSDEGFELTNAWSSRGSKYQGEEELRTKWLSFRDDVATPYTFNTLCRLVEDAGVDWIQVLGDLEPEFKPCPYSVVNQTAAAVTDVPNVEATPASEHPLAKFSLKGISAAIRKEAGDQVPLLGHIALMGQATALYAAPNTGKTLLVLFLLIEAIKNDRINPACFFYINMDDTLTGLSEKLEFAEKYGFHMLADGYQGFTPPRLVELLLELIASEHARDTVIVLDTLKKVTNLMDKTQSSNFAKLVRQFVLKGGTVIALAHTNKNPGPDGKPKFAGTTDIIDDFDCAYVLSATTTDIDATEKIVTFDNIKRRGDVARQAAYAYNDEDDLSYRERLLSVREVDLTEAADIRQAQEVKSDGPIIETLCSCIHDGIDTKMALAAATADRAEVSRREALRVIDTYTGSDPAIHRWTYSVGERGAKRFTLLNSDTEAVGSGTSIPEPLTP